MNVRNTMLFPAILLVTAACSAADSTLSSSDVTDLTASAGPATAVSTIRIDPAQAIVGIDSMVKLGANMYDAQGKRIGSFGGMTMRWVSSDTTIATVGVNGEVRGLRIGDVTIKAIAGTVLGESHVKVGAGASVATVPTTTEPATTSTSPPSNSTGPGLSGVALLSDDYTSYSSTAAFLNQVSSNIGGTGTLQTALYNDGANAQLASIDPNVRYNGHASLRYDMPGGTSSLPELWPSLPYALSTMWLRTKIRFGAGFTTTGTLTNSSNAYKLLGWGLAGVYGSGRLEITNTTQYDLYWSAVDVAGTTVVPNTDISSGPQIRTEWSDGKWYDYIIEYQITSPMTAVARFWLAEDGQVPVLQMTATRTAVAGQSMPQVSSVMLGMNFNQVRKAGQSQQLWYGQWEVVDGAKHPNPFGLAGNY